MLNDQSVSLKQQTSRYSPATDQKGCLYFGYCTMDPRGLSLDIVSARSWNLVIISTSSYMMNEVLSTLHRTGNTWNMSVSIIEHKKHQQPMTKTLQNHSTVKIFVHLLWHLLAQRIYWDNVLTFPPLQPSWPSWQLKYCHVSACTAIITTVPKDGSLPEL